MDIDFINQTVGYIYWKDLRGAYQGCNTEAVKNLGFNTQTDIIGKTDRELHFHILGEENILGIEEVDQEVMTKGVEKIVQEFTVNQTGALQAYLTKKAPIRDKQGKIIGLIGTSLDMSPLMNMQADVINYSMGNLFWKDIHGRFLGCNKSFANEMGYASPTELIGKTDNDLRFPDPIIAQKVRELDQEVIRTEKEIVREEMSISDTGEEKTYISKKGPLRNAEGKVIGIIGTAIEITQQKQAERIKTTFLENMRHDIRTPLTGIMGFAQLIKGEMKNTKIADYADNMMAASQALMNLLNEILEVIEITSGHVPHIKKRFNLKTTLISILDLESAKAKTENLSLTLEYDKKLPLALLGDNLRIHRVVLELVSNALKFTPKGSVVIKAALKKRSGRNLIVEISVADTGIGIPEDKQNEVFAQFTRLNPSHEGVYRGIGLGLTIVKQYVKDLEGNINIISSPMKGSTFVITLPLQESLVPEKTVDTKPEPAPLPLPHKKSTVLLVEDQDMPAKVATELLKNLACEIDHVKTGQSAILQAKAKKYDLILMDIGLPDINGNQVTKEIRVWENALNEHTPIIGLTAHVGTENKRQSIESGMDAVFSKPLMKDAAMDMLNAFVYKTKVMVIQEPNKKSNNKVIDLELGASVVGKDAAFAKSMIKTLVKTFPVELKKLKQAYEKADWNKVYDIAHRINGGVSYCGTPRLQKATAALQSYLNSGKTKDREILYQKLLVEIAAVNDAYKTL
ncbi:MAG TPA: PAS domain-containing protein [Gammaproteobacteria bacterium]|nr:PAS domain-containing protein [Gammaproteobacteria bacterium]